MNWRQLWTAGKRLVARGLLQVETKLKEWSKPAPDRQVTGIVTDLLRTKQELIAENAFLRQQVIVLKRQSPERPAITQRDRRILVVLASQLRGWKDALHLLKWHQR